MNLNTLQSFRCTLYAIADIQLIAAMVMTDKHVTFSFK